LEQTANRDVLGSIVDGGDPFFVRVGEGYRPAVVVYDGLIFTVVVTVKGNVDRCLSASCRLSGRRCQHARAVHELLMENPLPSPDEDALLGDEPPPLVEWNDGEDSSDGEEGGADEFIDDAGGPVPAGGGACAAVLVDETYTNCLDLSNTSTPMGSEDLLCSARRSRNFLPCAEEVRLTRKWCKTAEHYHSVGELGLSDRPETMTQFKNAAMAGDVFDLEVSYREPYCNGCGAPFREGVTAVDDVATLHTESRACAEIPVRHETGFLSSGQCVADRVGSVIVEAARHFCFMNLFLHGAHANQFCMPPWLYARLCMLVCVKFPLSFRR